MGTRYGVRHPRPSTRWTVVRGPSPPQGVRPPSRRPRTPNGMARPVIADVAARAGVSRTTVSHALSGKRPVSPSVLKRVREAMAELGYVPRRAAQTLKSGASQIVGLIVPDISNTFFADLAKVVEDVSLEQGYHVVFGNTAFEVERERLHPNMIRSRAVDGVVYAAGAPSPAPDTAEMLAGIPFVLVDAEVPGAGATSVVSEVREIVEVPFDRPRDLDVRGEPSSSNCACASPIC
ncbi:LacI family DNA-binding transcriptional regulator [Streptomyces sp. B5E4]